jgi:hypothetical protein
MLEEFPKERGREVGPLRVVRNLAVLTLAVVMVACAQRAANPDEDAGGTSPATQTVPDIGALVNHLKASGIPIGRVDIYTAENDPFKRLGRPGEYVGKAVFHDTRFPLPPNDFTQWGGWGGTIETFGTTADLESWKNRIRLARERDPTAPPEWQYEKRLALIRMGSVLTPDQAKAYEAAIASFPG